MLPTPSGRKPLTFANVGLYGGWNAYFLSEYLPFDYLIVQASVDDELITWHDNRDGRDKTPWNEHLKRARANGLRMIARPGLTVTDDKGVQQSFQALYNIENPLPVERFFERFDRFFEQVDEQQLYAVTIGEEHVFWNGQQERLAATYEYLKKKYDVPLYQWYWPRQHGRDGGHELAEPPRRRVALDEYSIQQPVLEQAMRMYTVMRKPSFQIIWRRLTCRRFRWSDKTFWDQYAVCRKYNIPIAFFNWAGRDDSPHSDTWGWDANASGEHETDFRGLLYLRRGSLPSACGRCRSANGISSRGAETD